MQAAWQLKTRHRKVHGGGHRRRALAFGVDIERDLSEYSSRTCQDFAGRDGGAVGQRRQQLPSVPHNSSIEAEESCSFGFARHKPPGTCAAGLVRLSVIRRAPDA